MAHSNFTKRALAAALKKLLAENPFEKIGIGDICAECGMNRKSFYYHFHDKYELVVWIFETEFSAEASTRADNAPWSEISRLCRYFYQNKAFYRKIFQIGGQNCFAEHFSELCRRSLTDRIEKNLPRISAKEHSIDLCSDFFVHSVHRWIAGNDSRTDTEFVSDMKSGILLASELAGVLSQKAE